jgi:hypothetical protein
MVTGSSSAECISYRSGNVFHAQNIHVCCCRRMIFIQMMKKVKIKEFDEITNLDKMELFDDQQFAIFCA